MAYDKHEKREDKFKEYEQQEVIQQDVVETYRFDLKTRICLMAAFIFGSMDIEVDEAVEAAVEIENTADARVRKMKRDNPIAPRPKGAIPDYVKPHTYNKEKKISSIS